jgi:cytosine/adenosine deaminase-related metal-dependent hydrolase
MIAHVSKWVLPVDQPPIRDGAVVVEGDRIAAVGPAAEVLCGFKGLICEHGDGAIMPGVVNSHVHLEFSALAGRVPPQARWEDWLTATLAAYGEISPTEVEAGIGRALEALWHNGSVLVGEVTNTGASWPFLQASSLSYHLFYECLGFHLVEDFDLPEVFPFLGQPEVETMGWISAAAHAP